jgi:DNA-directed RNA polymerase subunit RPC12/RpoP
VSLDRPEPVAGAYERRRSVRGRLGTGTLACPRCDAPVLGIGRLAVGDGLGCPYCGHEAIVRDFLSLAQPTRPARVAVRIRMRVAHRPR